VFGALGECQVHGFGGRRRAHGAVDLPAGLEDHDATAQREREADLRQRSVSSADRDHRVAAGNDREVPRMADPGDDDMVDPLVCVLTPLAGKDSDGRSTRGLRPAGHSRHHLSATAADDGASTLGEQPADLFRSRLVLGAAADDRNLGHGAAFP
jgi:hypothetical protein